MVEASTGIVVIILIIGFFAMLGALAASRYKKVAPDQAMVVYGRKGYRVVTGGAKLIWPVFDSYEFLPLDVRTLDVKVNDIVTDVTTSGARVNVRAVAQIKISSKVEILSVAAEHLLHKTNAEINEIAHKTMEGHVRGFCANLTIEDINSDRTKVSKMVLSNANQDLLSMGIEIRSFVIKEIDDEHGYLEALGVARTEKVKSDARIGKAEFNRDATVKEAQMAQEGEQANAEAEAQVALFHRDRDLTRQKAEAEVEIERANKEISFELQDAKRRQELVVEQRNIDIRDREQRIELQKREVMRRGQEQKAEQVVPAEAHADAIAAEADGTKRKAIITSEGDKEANIINADGEKQAAVLNADGEKQATVLRAEGDKTKTILLAEAERERLSQTADGERARLMKTAEGEATHIRETGTAEAEIIKLKGDAEAEAILAKGLAEAEAMQKKADAWKQYGSAAVTEMIVDQLPSIVGEAAKTLENTDKLIVMGNRGPSELVGSVVDVAAQAPALVKALSGMDMTELVGNVKGTLQDPKPKK